MAKKPVLKKGAANKSAAVISKKMPAAKPASKPAPAVKKPVPAKPAAKAAKGAAPKPGKPAPAKAAAAAPVKAAPAAPAKPAAAKAAAPAPSKPAAAAPKPAAPAPVASPVVSTPPPAPKPVPALKVSGTGGALTISAQSSPGAAGNGNTHPANILALVTSGGWPIVDLSKDHFTLMEHFEVPGQQSPLSNNIVSFRNAGTGAYLLQVKPINGAPWRVGHHLVQLLVSSPDDLQGQVAVKLIIR